MGAVPIASVAVEIKSASAAIVNCDLRLPTTRARHRYPVVIGLAVVPDGPYPSGGHLLIRRLNQDLITDVGVRRQRGSG